jgi:hypothetical protein
VAGEEVRRRFTGGDGTATRAIWSDVPWRLRLYGDRLLLLVGQRGETERLRVLDLRLGALALILTILLAIWCAVRWPCRLIHARIARRRHRQGRCVVCGYQRVAAVAPAPEVGG